MSRISGSYHETHKLSAHANPRDNRPRLFCGEPNWPAEGWLSQGEFGASHDGQDEKMRRD